MFFSCKFSFLFFFFGPAARGLLVVACGTLVPWPGIKPAPPALEAQSQPLGRQGRPSCKFAICGWLTLRVWQTGIQGANYTS